MTENRHTQNQYNIIKEEKRQMKNSIMITNLEGE